MNVINLNAEIKYQGNWYKVGDSIEMKNRILLIFWYLPLILKKQYRITLIGDDCAASVESGNNTRTISGSMRNFS